ncbi:MAG TPA: nucleotidyltransferase domain-containing protein [Azospirillum sp.]|nr:nucleotidyltransferase domain-containing protein [Azospirillum sp.]
MDLDPQTRAAIAAFRQGVERLYGNRLEAVLLFGSRARGDFRDDSDLDLAVVLRDRPGDPLDEADRIMDAVFVPTMDAGRVVQPLVLSVGDLKSSQHPLIQGVRAEGVPV